VRNAWRDQRGKTTQGDSLFQFHDPRVFDTRSERGKRKEGGRSSHCSYFSVNDSPK